MNAYNVKDDDLARDSACAAQEAAEAATACRHCGHQEASHTDDKGNPVLCWVDACPAYEPMGRAKARARAR